MKIVKKKPITLIEMMIVMFLIATITGIVAYNWGGALDEGKAFKTKTAISRLTTILSLALSENPGLEQSIEQEEVWEGIVRRSPLTQNPASLIYDSWGDRYRVEVRDGKIVVSSDQYNDYLRKKKESASHAR